MMSVPRQFSLYVGVTLLVTLTTASGQGTNAAVAISNPGTNLVVSWTGPGTLQYALDLSGPWQDLLESTNSFGVIPTNGQSFFRSISRWGRGARLLQANSEMAVAELAGRIYVMGGYPSSRATVRTVQVYDSTLDSWQLTTPLPIALNHAMPAAANGRVYLIGGQTDSGSTSFTDTLFEFDPVTTNWTARAPMPTARSAGAAAVVDNLIFVAGGRPPRGQDFAVYDVTENTWQTLASMPTGRNHLAAAAINGKIYVAGGRLGAGFTSQMTAVLEVYDPATGNWSSLAPLPIPRGGVNGIAVNGCFFVFGGEGPNGVFDDMDMYSPEQDRWYSLEPLPVAVHGVTGSAFLNGRIHLPGGGTATGGSSGSTLHQLFWVGPLCP